MPNQVPSTKITFPLIVAALCRLRDEAFSTDPPQPENLDRKRALHRLMRDLHADESELLRWGFDRAHRQIVEGL